ncbi:hypothetical protein HRJ34_15645 [Rhizorhabdus wittichii]|uniref:Tip attachment protein J domain-containing protein n=1 Tax=Rhizorhabdus wittichii TaxID=160791 RepID=A0A975HC21_9SPHN|nr:hypothetical protein [Rhizorhabdus wittichii]QTH19798.1 hypothetical protein HRJ34_15645 [Rhizorhabdus wittichii]
MGKTLGTIVSIAAAAGLAYLTLGASSALSTLAAAGVDIGTAGAIAGVALTGAGLLSASYALQTTSGLLGLGPKAPKPDTTDIARKIPIPPRVAGYGRSKLFGTYILFETSEGYDAGFSTIGAGTAVDVYAIHDGPIDAIEQYYLGDDLVTLVGNTVQEGTDGRYKDGKVKIYATLGETPGTWLSAIGSLIPAWDDSHRGDGVVIVGATFEAVKAKDFQDVYPTGLPPAVGIAARWQKCFDWRDEAQSVDDPSTWTWTENAVLQTAHYKLVREKAKREPGEVFPSGPNLQATWGRYFAPTVTYWTAAADDADSDVALKAGGTEPRYRSCVAHELTSPHKEVISALTACFDGWLAARADGALIVYSGRYYDPTVSIGPDEILSFTVTDGIDDEAEFNEYAVSYVSADHQFSTVDTTPWQDTAAIEAAGAIKSTGLANQVPSHGQARRLAKRTMMRARAPKRGTLTTNNAGMAVRGERFVNVHLEEAGTVFYSGPVEIVRLTRNLLFGVTFDWVLADPSVDDWDPATEEGDPAPVGESVTPSALFPPVITSATVDHTGIGETEGGEITPGEAASGARILIEATGPVREDMTWYARWRVGTTGSWSEREYNDLDPMLGVTILTEFVPIATNINVQVSYSIGDGRSSPWSDVEVVDTTF